MSTTIKKTTVFEASTDALLEILTDPDFHVAREKAQGALEVSSKDVSRTDDKLVQDIQTVEYAKGVTGIDRSKTETNVTTEEWSLKAKTCSWTHKGPHGSRVKVWGSIKIEPAGEKGKLVSDFHIDVKIPLVGGKVEKMIAKEVEKGWPKYDDVVRDYCKQRG